MKPKDKLFNKGISITMWEEGRVSIEKSYKLKDSDEYKKTTTYFDSEIVDLRDLLDEWIEKYELQKNEDLKASIDDECPF